MLETLEVKDFSSKLSKLNAFSVLSSCTMYISVPLFPQFNGKIKTYFNNMCTLKEASIVTIRRQILILEQFPLLTDMACEEMEPTYVGLSNDGRMVPGKILV